MNLIDCATSVTAEKPVMTVVAIAGVAAGAARVETDVRYTSFADKPAPTGQIEPEHLDQSKAAEERGKAALDVVDVDNERESTARLDKTRLDGVVHR